MNSDMSLWMGELDDCLLVVWKFEKRDWIVDSVSTLNISYDFFISYPLMD